MAQPELRTRDMYGSPIYPIGDTGYGVSLMGVRPMFNLFHESDGFRQSLLSVDALRPEGPCTLNSFLDRIAEVRELELQVPDGDAEDAL